MLYSKFIIRFYIKLVKGQLKCPILFRFLIIILIFIHIILIIKESILYLSNDYSMKLYLFDLSYFAGGIVKFNQIIIILCNLFALTLIYYIFPTKNALITWIDLGEVCCNSIQASKFFDQINLKKMSNFSNRIIFFLTSCFYLSGMCIIFYDS